MSHLKKLFFKIGNNIFIIVHFLIFISFVFIYLNSIPPVDTSPCPGGYCNVGNTIFQFIIFVIFFIFEVILIILQISYSKLKNTNNNFGLSSYNAKGFLGWKLVIILPFLATFLILYISLFSQVSFFSTSNSFVLVLLNPINLINILLYYFSIILYSNEDSMEKNLKGKILLYKIIVLLFCLAPILGMIIKIYELNIDSFMYYFSSLLKSLLIISPFLYFIFKHKETLKSIEV